MWIFVTRRDKRIQRNQEITFLRSYSAVRCQVNELKHVKLCNDPLKYLNIKNNKKTEVFFLKLWNKKHHFSFHVSYLCLISFIFKRIGGMLSAN